MKKFKENKKKISEINNYLLAIKRNVDEVRDYVGKDSDLKFEDIYKNINVLTNSIMNLKNNFESSADIKNDRINDVQDYTIRTRKIDGEKCIVVSSKNKDEDRKYIIHSEDERPVLKDSNGEDLDNKLVYYCVDKMDKNLITLSTNMLIDDKEFNNIKLLTDELFSNLSNRRGYLSDILTLEFKCSLSSIDSNSITLDVFREYTPSKRALDKTSFRTTFSIKSDSYRNEVRKTTVHLNANTRIGISIDKEYVESKFGKEGLRVLYDVLSKNNIMSISQEIVRDSDKLELNKGVYKKFKLEFQNVDSIMSTIKLTKKRKSGRTRSDSLEDMFDYEYVADSFESMGKEGLLKTKVVTNIPLRKFTMSEYDNVSKKMNMNKYFNVSALVNDKETLNVYQSKNYIILSSSKSLLNSKYKIPKEIIDVIKSEEFNKKIIPMEVCSLYPNAMIMYNLSKYDKFDYNIDVVRDVKVFSNDKMGLIYLIKKY